MQKLGLIDKLKKQQILKKLKKESNIEIYIKLKPSLKKDLEISKEVLYCVKKPEDFRHFSCNFIEQNINRYPENIQELFFLIDKRNIKYLNVDIQYNLIKNKDEFSIHYVNNALKERLVREDIKFLQYLNLEEKEDLCLKDQQLLSSLTQEDQLNLALQNNEFLPFCSLTFGFFSKPENIKKIPDDFLLEYAEINHLDLNDYYSLLRIKYEYNSSNIMMNFVRYANKKPLKEFENYLKADSTILPFVYQCNIEFQNKIYQISNEIIKKNILPNVIITMTVPNSINYSIDFVKEKFKELYGKNKYQEYLILFENHPNDFINTTDILYSLIKTKNSIVLKNDAQKVIEFFQNMKQKNKTQEDFAHLYNDFYDLIGNTYGPDALNFLKERPGLNYEDISNIEIFSPNILRNFRKGFIDDLLSYNFDGYVEEFINICNDPQQLEAFKLLYSRFSANLGENVGTMLLAFSRYNEYKDLLRDFTSTKVDNENLLNKLDEVCMWPINIAKITNVSELSNLEERLLSALTKREKIELTNPYDYQLSLNREDVLYNYDKYLEENKNSLTKSNLLLLDFLIKNKNLSYNYNGLSSNEILKYKKEGGNLSNLFQKIYILRKNIQDQAMNYFQNHVVTDKSYIDKKIENHEDDAYKINVCGVEFYDLGNINVNFAVHELMRGNSVDFTTASKMQSEFLSHESKDGISTISAYPIHGILNDHKGYIFWDFSDNHIMNLKRGQLGHDGRVSHSRKLIFSNGDTDLSLFDYSNIDEEGQEIAFYRRKRNHEAIENLKYGGKIIPDAIKGKISMDTLDTSMGKFGKKIPIILSKGSLNTERGRKSARQRTISTFIDMYFRNKEANSIYNYHIPDDLSKEVHKDFDLIQEKINSLSQDGFFGNIVHEEEIKNLNDEYFRKITEFINSETAEKEKLSNFHK